MKLLFKQRFFSWFDSYDIYNEHHEVVYVVKGQLSWGHCLKIFDATGREVGMVKQRVWTWMPKFDLYEGGTCLGTIERKFTLLRPTYEMPFKGWYVSGSFWEWDYNISDEDLNEIAVISKQLNWTDTYQIDVKKNEDALYALMFVLAIDAEKCSRNNH